MGEIRDARVRYVVNKRNLGLAGSVNRGVSLMPEDVEWCTVLCDDDALDEGFIAYALEAAAERNAAAVVHGHRVFMSVGGAVLRDALPSPDEESAYSYMVARSRGTRETYLTGTLFRRSAFEEIGGYPSFPTGIASDDAFLFALALGDRLVCAPEAKAHIRIHPHAESHSLTDFPKIYESLKAFHAYCVAAIANRGRPGPRIMERAGETLRSYTRIVISSYWVDIARKALDRGDPGTQEILAGLYSLVNRDPDAFTARVRCGAFLGRTTGVFPEAFLPYRTIWSAIYSAYKGIARMVP